MTYACCNFDTKIDHCVSRAKVERLLFNDLQIKSKLTVNSFELNCNARGHNKKYFCWMKLLFQLSVAQKSSFIIQECNRRQQDARMLDHLMELWKSDLKKKRIRYQISICSLIRALTFSKLIKNLKINITNYIPSTISFYFHEKFY